MAEEDNDLATPEAHARATDNVIRLKNRRTINGVGASETFTAKHQAAAQLHGWNAHKQATVEEFTLTRENYLAALEVAEKGEAPHADALSEYAPKTQSAEPAKVPAATRKARRR